MDIFQGLLIIAHDLFDNLFGQAACQDADKIAVHNILDIDMEGNGDDLIALLNTDCIAVRIL